MAAVQVVDDQNPTVVYQGTWHSLINESQVGAFNSTLTYATEVNSTVLYTFEGELTAFTH